MSHDPQSPIAATTGSVEHGDSAGDITGTATLVDLCGVAQSRGGRPGALNVLKNDTTKIVAFEFAAGDVLADHAAHHPVLIQVVRGRVEFTLPDGPVELAPGQVLHLTPKLRHCVKALESTTLTVTMLLPHQ